MPIKCKACKGTYTPIQSDGSHYTHVCAPTGYKPDGRPIERPNKRDENIKLDAKGDRAGMKAEGDGVETAPEE